ncbi:MAG: DNA polymerase, partial [Bacilli bacterium]|nr:DNA polymerase [Bacilli bacterium]
YFALKLKENVQKLLKKEGVDELYHTIELPLAIVLAEMEIEGFPLQVDVLKAIGETFSKQINILSEQIFILAGEIINLNSPKQVGELLYDKLLLPRPKKDSTSFEVLSKLSDEYEIVRLILEYR